MPLRNPQKHRSQGGLTGFLIKYNIVDNAQQAKYILIGLVVICVLILLYLNRPGAHVAPIEDTEEDILIDQMIENEPTPDPE